MKNLLEIISPARNEKINLDRLINDYQIIEKKLSKININTQIKFIDDCSNDGTGDIFIDKIKNLNLKYNFVRNYKNKGFSQTCIDAIANSEAEYCLILPGDAEVDVDGLDLNDIQEYDVIWYSRSSLETRPISRVLISKLYKYIISITLMSRVRDYNGIYLIKTKLFNSLKIKSKSFFINAEVYTKFIKKNEIRKEFKFIKLRNKVEYKSQSLSFRMFNLVIHDYIRVFFIEKLLNRLTIKND